MLTFKDHETVPWYAFAKNYQVNADIFILTAGAHFVDSGDGVQVFEGLRQQVVDVRNSWHSRDPKNQKKILWKTQAPGHVRYHFLFFFFFFTRTVYDYLLVSSLKVLTWCE